MTQPSNPNGPRNPEQKPPIRENGPKNSSFSGLKKPENIDQLYNLAKSNTWDTAALGVLFVGIILSTFSTFYGGLLVGLVAGFYFAEDTIRWAKNVQDYVEKEGVIRVLILGGLALGLFISAPGIFIGAAAAIGLKLVISAISSK